MLIIRLWCSSINCLKIKSRLFPLQLDLTQTENEFTKMNVLANKGTQTHLDALKFAFFPPYNQ